LSLAPNPNSSWILRCESKDVHFLQLWYTYRRILTQRGIK
jgi:hypothetical protein